MILSDGQRYSAMVSDGDVFGYVDEIVVISAGSVGSVGIVNS